MKKTLAQGPLRKNLFTLWAKYFADELLGRNAFIHSGKSITQISHTPASPSLTILIPTAFFLDRGLAWQATIAKAFEVRGHKVIFMPLDLHFPRRNGLYGDDQDAGFISYFYNLYTSRFLGDFRFTVAPYSTYGTTRKFTHYKNNVASFTHEECESYISDSLPLGKLALNSVIHHFRCSTTTRSAEITDAYQDYLAMGHVLAETIRAAYSDIKPDLIFTLNGSFLDSGLHLAIAKEMGIRAVTFEAGFMLNALMLGFDEPIITFPMSKYLPNNWSSYKLNAEQSSKLDTYLSARRNGKESVFDYWGNPILDHTLVKKELGLRDDQSPDILFTNLLWDSSTIDCDVAWASQVDWISDTIQWYQQHPDRTLLVRIHPAETHPTALATSDPIEAAIRHRWQELPKNVILIPPSSTISSYPLTEISHLNLVYASTAGLEAVILGKTVLVAGKTHYRDQGFTHDITTKDQYFQLLEQATPYIPTEQAIQMARTYAYLFFFCFNRPFPLVQEQSTEMSGPAVTCMYTSEEELLPDRNPELDVVISLILGKTRYQDLFITATTI